MFFKKISIIGTGLIGASLALAFRRKGIGEELIGIDLPGVVNKAVAQKIIDKGYEPTEIQKGVQDADLIVLATNINQITQYLKPVMAAAKKNAIITDVGSSKERIVFEAEQEIHNSVYFIGGHPMAGSEKNGLEAADPFLFENCFYILSPVANTPSEITNRLIEVLELIGAKVLILDAAVHDKIAAAVSHLPQVLAVCLVNFIKKFNQQQPQYFKLAAGGFRDMTRIASSPFSMWQDICETNTENIVHIIDDFIFELNQFKDSFSQPKLKEQFEKAATARLSIPKDTKGFIHPNFDITVIVEDEPGVIAKIAVTLADKNINIRDIEILKVRLLEGGTMRLSLESEKERDAAIALLKKKGFNCWKR